MYRLRVLDLMQVVYVHPTDLPGPLAKGLHPATVDFLADTTRTAASMVRHKLCAAPGLHEQMSSE